MVRVTRQGLAQREDSLHFVEEFSVEARLTRRVPCSRFGDLDDRLPGEAALFHLFGNFC